MKKPSHAFFCIHALRVIETDNPRGWCELHMPVEKCPCKYQIDSNGRSQWKDKKQEYGAENRGN